MYTLQVTLAKKSGGHVLYYSKSRFWIMQKNLAHAFSSVLEVKKALASGEIQVPENIILVAAVGPKGGVHHLVERFKNED